MRHPGAPAAAALLVLALGFAGCKPSSLTPFGIGWREPDTASSNVNGLWEGTTASGGEVRFLVGSDKVNTFVLRHVSAACTQTFEAPVGEEPVTGDTFSIEIIFDQGRMVVSGRFSSAASCTGSYVFEALAVAGDCPTSGSGSFSATKTF